MIGSCSCADHSGMPMPRRLRSVLPSMSGIMIRRSPGWFPRSSCPARAPRVFARSAAPRRSDPIPSTRLQGPSRLAVYSGASTRACSSVATLSSTDQQQQGGAQTAADLADDRVQRIYPDRPVEVVDRRDLVTNIAVNPAQGVTAHGWNSDSAHKPAAGYASPRCCCFPRNAIVNAGEGQGHRVIAGVGHHVFGQRQTACSLFHAQPAFRARGRRSADRSAPWHGHSRGRAPARAPAASAPRQSCAKSGKRCTFGRACRQRS